MSLAEARSMLAAAANSMTGLMPCSIDWVSHPANAM